MKLIRDDKSASGIFGVLFLENGTFLCQTLEHSYSDPNSSGFIAKIPPGIYTCVRGMHTLKPTPLNPNPQPFDTFEITGVPNHDHILFHAGNFNKDSEGCVLVGTTRVGEAEMLQSRLAFYEFMAQNDGINSFTLTVS